MLLCVISYCWRKALGRWEISAGLMDLIPKSLMAKVNVMGRDLFVHISGVVGDGA